jgi:hypothetical protein
VSRARHPTADEERRGTGGGLTGCREGAGEVCSWLSSFAMSSLESRIATCHSKR